MEKKLTNYINKRLKSIQSRWNFNPNSNSLQVKDDTASCKDYGEFKCLLNIVDKFKLEVSIPYDPSGLNPKEHLHKRKQAKRYIYLAQVEGTNVWKIGCSKTPFNRVSNLQIGHDKHLILKYKFEGSFDLESKIKRKFKKFKTRDKNKNYGEWFNLSETEALDIMKEYGQING